jgi:branched-chain amino acid transport system ATP-binding protein
MSFIIIEHDLDVALRVVERVTVMHDGHVLKHGTPSEIERDADVQAIYIGAGPRGGGHREGGHG